jgi:putative NADH-flavin reductase
MKIAVYGANGNIGTQIVAEAVRRGHEVTAITRSGTEVEGATSVRGDLADAAEFSAIAGDHDVVVISLGPSRTGEPASLLVDAHRAVVNSAPTSRIFVVGGAGSLVVGDTLLKDTPDFPDAYKPSAAIMTEVLDVYQASTGIDWTVLSPAPMIGPGERTGTYTVGTNSPVGENISQEDFAVAVLDELETPQHRSARFTVAN